MDRGFIAYSIHKKRKASCYKGQGHLPNIALVIRMDIIYFF